MQKIFLEIQDLIGYFNMPKKKAWAFNDTQIKDGWIVKLRKDGTIKAKIEPWYPRQPKKSS